MGRALSLLAVLGAVSACTPLSPPDEMRDGGGPMDLSPSCDADGDGYASPACGGMDCNDANASVHPGATEHCNGVDDDCDGAVDGADATHECQTAPNVATAVCVAAACSTTCLGAYLDCTPDPGCETNGMTDGNHCGSCTHVCVNDPAAGCLSGGVCAGDITQISAGGQHTCARRAGGTIGCWGGNGWGELGDGTMMGHGVPAAVTGVADAIQVASGDGNTCLVRVSGAVQCWGANSDGNLGDGTQVERLTPTAVVGITDVAQVTVGRGHTCARVNSVGSVYCWGGDKFGEIGSGSFPHSACGTHDCALSATSVTGISNAADIAAGDLHTCAALSGGTVVCWGSDQLGQLGNGSMSETSCGGVDCSSIPVAVTGLTNAVEVASGVAHSCARLASGAVACWGANNQGQLGDGLATHADCGGTDCATAPVMVSGLSDARHITAGGDHTCALKSDGTVVCWGSNISGQIGDGAVAHSTCGGVDCALAPFTALGLHDAVAVTAGQIHTCARRATGEVLCWGENGNGQLGDGTMVQHNAPTPITDP